MLLGLAALASAATGPACIFTHGIMATRLGVPCPACSVQPTVSRPQHAAGHHRLAEGPRSAHQESRSRLLSPGVAALIHALRHLAGCHQARAPTPLHCRLSCAEAALPPTDRKRPPHVAAASFSGAPRCAAAMLSGRAPLPQSRGAAPPSREPIGATAACSCAQRWLHKTCADDVTMRFPSTTWPDSRDTLGEVAR